MQRIEFDTEDAAIDAVMTLAYDLPTASFRLVRPDHEGAPFVLEVIESLN